MRSLLLALGVTLSAFTFGAPAGAATLDESWRQCTSPNPDLAIGGCTAVIQSGQETSSNVAIAFYNRGRAYLTLGQYEKAVADYDQAILLKPNDAGSYANRGVAYVGLRQHQKAIADFDQAIRLDPNYAGNYFNRGFAYISLGQNQRAIADFDQAIRLDPNYTKAYKTRGDAYYLLGQYQKAIADYDQVVRLDPGNANIYDARANTYSKLGQSQKAIADYNQAIRLDPNFEDAYFNRADEYEKLGQYKNAVADFESSVRLDTNDAWNNRRLARLLAACPDAKYRNGARAVTLALKAVQLAPDDRTNHDVLAAAYAEVGKFADAVREEQTAIKMAKDAKASAKDVADFEARLALYQQGKPYRLTAPAAQTSDNSIFGPKSAMGFSGALDGGMPDGKRFDGAFSTPDLMDAVPLMQKSEIAPAAPRRLTSAEPGVRWINTEESLVRSKAFKDRVKELRRQGVLQVSPSLLSPTSPPVAGYTVIDNSVFDRATVKPSYMVAPRVVVRPQQRPLQVQPTPAQTPPLFGGELVVTANEALPRTPITLPGERAMRSQRSSNRVPTPIERKVIVVAPASGELPVIKVAPAPVLGTDLKAALDAEIQASARELFGEPAGEARVGRALGGELAAVKSSGGAGNLDAENYKGKTPVDFEALTQEIKASIKVEEAPVVESPLWDWRGWDWTAAYKASRATQ